jgi:orotidine-5'-phosphate decarboxylase
MKSPIILALDTKDLSEANSWITATRDSISIYKVGLELFLRIGIDGTRKLATENGVELFLDLKLHDIPNTVGQAVASVSELNPRFLTVHASGGSEMISSAVKSAGSTSITAVTILTSLNNADLREIGFSGNALESAVSLAKLSVAAGARSIVCSPFEVEEIRKNVPSNIELITPGVRPIDSELGDQKRAATPQEAIQKGANFVVIGRPITSFARESLDSMRARAANLSAQLI